MSPSTLVARLSVPPRKLPKSSPPTHDRDDGASLASPEKVAASVRREVMLDHPTLAVASIHRGRIRRINASWHTLFALPPDVSVESHVATLFPNSASADRFERQLKADLAAPDSKSAVRSEQLLMRRDGSALLCEVIVWLLDTEAEHPLNADAIWQVRDITVERALRRELRDLGDYHRELSRLQSGITLVIDRKGRVSYASASVERVLGHPVNSLLGTPFSSLLDPTDAPAAEQWLRAASHVVQGESGDGFALRLVDRDGVTHDLASRSIDCFKSPRIAGLVLHAKEPGARASQTPDEAVTADAARLRGLLLAAARDADRSAASLASFLETMCTGLGASSVVCWQAAGVGSSERWAVRSSAPASAVLPPLASDRVAPGDAGPLVIGDLANDSTNPNLAAAMTVSHTAAIIEVPVQVDGETVGWIAVGASLPRVWADAEIDFVVGAALLVGRALARDDVLTGTLDALTGLPGRIEAERHLADSAAAPDGRPFVVLAVDLCRLQEVNDTSGCAVGDAVITRTATVLLRIAGSDGFVARVDGDEFIVVVRCDDLHDAASLAQAVLDGVAAIGSDDTIRAQVEASVGVARFPQDARDGAALWMQAGLAMREARSRGRGQAFVFNQKLATSLRLREVLDGEIEDALRGDEFTIFYQPQLSLSTGLVVGFEALLRWQHPTRGLLLPEAFIQAAFRRGLVDVVTKLVLTQVCEQIATWRRSVAPPELPVSVNVSGKQFHDRRLPALVASALLKSGLPARLLVLEITEQSLVGDDAGIERVVRELSRLGVRVAIGDFNLGHASFKYLKQLRVSQIKLGNHFVKELPGNVEDAMLVSAVVDLAHRLKYDVVAEGVETRAQFEHLRAIGCEAGQGFYLGAPLAAADVAAYLESNRKKPVH